MNVTPQLILHVGAPKCGSTALQNALSMTPDLTDIQGQSLRYTAWRQMGKFGSALYGRDVVQAAQASAYGYVSWPNFRPDDPATDVFAGLDRVRRAGLTQGHIPIASCEGWISRPEAFAPHLARWGHPPVEVVAFLRPVVEWNNSAFWQWGIWNVPSLDAWLRRGNLRYSFGRDLEAWSKIPNVRVRFAWAQPDAGAQFARWYGVALEPALTRNTSSSPPLVGVLMRHRRLRPNGHDAATEFVVQRWCPPVEGRKLWSVMARHVHDLRPVTQQNLNALRRISSDASMRAVCEDRRWTQEQRHHSEILAGISPLNDCAQLAGLHASLAAGLARISQAMDRPAPVVPPCPQAQADLAQWDAVLVAMIDTLLAADAALRAQMWRKGGSGRLWPRTTAAIGRMHDHLFNRSR